MSHLLHDYVAGRLAKMLRDRCVVVWYDPRAEFEPFLDELEGIGEASGALRRVRIADVDAWLARYDGSFFGLRAAVEPVVGKDRPEPTLIYVPGVARDRKGSVLMELEKGGVTYEPQLRRIAQQALRSMCSDHEIDRMLAPEGLTYADIARLAKQVEAGGTTSLLRSLFPGESSMGILCRWLADSELDPKITEKGAAGELLDLIGSRLGLELAPGTDLPRARAHTTRYVLVNEFRADLGCEPPEILEPVPSPPTADHAKRVQSLARELRTRHPDRYQELADGVEQELSLASAGVEAAHLGAVDTFRFEERQLLDHAGALLVQKDYEGALRIASERSRSFWVDRDVQRQAQWEVCRRMAELGLALEQVRREVARVGPDPERWVTAYAAPEGWHRVDRLQRSLESCVASMDEEPELEQALGLLRRAHEELLREMAEGFSRALRAAGWAVPGVLHQTGVFPEIVEGTRERTAYFLVDAMRYEMGAELAELLESAEDLALRPAVAALPTITPVGMAALLPGASASFSVVEHKGKLAARIGESVLAGMADRRKYLKALLPEAKEIDLGTLLQKSVKALRRTLADAPFVLVRSQAIDGLGEMDGGLLARHIMDTVVSNVARAVRKLARVGVERFVITADHGHQFALRKGEHMLVDRVGGDTVDEHRRCWIGRGGQTPAGCVRATAAELGYDSDLEFVFPTGLGVFRTGGDLAYHHGGISLQELVVPVVTLRIPAEAAAGEARLTVEIRGCPEEITNRTFGVRIRVSGDLFTTEPVPMRAVVVSKGEQVGEAGMAVDAEFDRGRKVVRVDPKKEAIVGLMLTRDDCETVRIVAQAPDTDAVLAQSDEIPVRLGI